LCDGESEIKKGPKTRAWSDRCTHSQDASGQPNPSLEVGPRIRALTLEIVMMFTMGWSHSNTHAKKSAAGLPRRLRS
jgi:hypothetical protein